MKGLTRISKKMKQKINSFIPLKKDIDKNITLSIGKVKEDIKKVTSQIQKAFFGLFDGSTKDSWGWLEPIQ